MRDGQHVWQTQNVVHRKKEHNENQLQHTERTLLALRLSVVVVKYLE